MDNEMVRILLDIQKDVSATKTMVDALGGENGRVTNLEKDQNRNFWVTVAIVPALTAVHATLRKFGINI